MEKSASSSRRKMAFETFSIFLKFSIKSFSTLFTAAFTVGHCCAILICFDRYSAAQIADQFSKIQFDFHEIAWDLTNRYVSVLKYSLPLLNSLNGVQALKLGFSFRKKGGKDEGEFSEATKFEASPWSLKIPCICQMKDREPNCARERIKSSSSDWFDSLFCLELRLRIFVVFVIVALNISLHDSLECCKCWCCASSGGVEREKSSLQHAAQHFFIFWSYHPSLISPPPPLSSLLIAFSRYSNKECMLFSYCVCCSAPYYMTQRTESLSLMCATVCVCLCLFLWVFRRWCCFLFSFVLVGGKK